MKRREFLAGAAGLAAAARVGRTVAATAKGGRPLPELVPEGDLPVVSLDVEASRARQTLVLAGNRPILASPQGAVVEIPAGASVPVKWWWLAVEANSGAVPGARIILRGAAGGGGRPRLHAPGDNALLEIHNRTGHALSFELENLELEAGIGGPVVSGTDMRLVRLADCALQGGKECLFLPSGRTVAQLEDCVLRRGGQGDGYSHTVYINYIERFLARRTTFAAARAEGHAFKCYAANIGLHGCTIAGWQSLEDRDGGFYGMLPPADIGAWSNSTIADSTFIRRGPTRDYCLEYRNRQWPRGSNAYVAPDWGTAVVDYRKVDNRDPANPFLFHHFLVNNRFVNGLLPDGGIDPAIRANPGIAVRNNGTAPWDSPGDAEPGPRSQPADYRPFNERAVVWAVGNHFDGVPFATEFDEHPGDRPDRYAPIRRLGRLPDWARLEG